MTQIFRGLTQSLFYQGMQHEASRIKFFLPSGVSQVGSYVVPNWPCQSVQHGIIRMFAHSFGTKIKEKGNDATQHEQQSSTMTDWLAG
jgi:hypothetical protein